MKQRNRRPGIGAHGVANRENSKNIPGFPVVPGVALVDWAVRLAGRYLQIGDGVARALQVKFRRIVAPGNVITLVLEHHPARNRLAFTYRQGEQIFASGTFQASP